MFGEAPWLFWRDSRRSSAMRSNEPQELRSAIPAFWGDLILGYTLLGLQPVTVKVLSTGRLNALDTVFLRFVFSAVCIAMICALRRRFISTQQPLWFCARGTLGAIAVLLYFSSVAEVGAARATLLNYTYPFWANVFAVFFGSRPSRRFWIGLLVASVGVVIVISPGALGSPLTLSAGDLLGLMSAVVAGASVLVIKQLRKTDDALSIVGAFTLGGLLMSSFGEGRAEVLSTFTEPEFAWAAWGVGITSFLGHLLFTRGYRGATVPQATLLSLMVPVVATGIGVFVLNEGLGVNFWLGATLVVVSQVYVAREGATKRQSISS